MNNSHLEDGDLAFLPSDITLIKLKKGKASGTVQSWVKTKNPCHVLVVNTEVDNYVEILYDGSRWLARPIDIYPAIKNKENR